MDTTKTHLSDGDKLVWYKDNTIVATWHSNGRVDLFDKQDIAICEANFRILKGHWRNSDEHGVGTEPNHWLFNGTPVSEYLVAYPNFWKKEDNLVRQQYSTPDTKIKPSTSKLKSSTPKAVTVETHQGRRIKKKSQKTINIFQERLAGQVGCNRWSNDDWGTIAFEIPRCSIRNQFIEDELKFNGIYFLVDTEHCYVGQALIREKTGESFLERFREHDSNYDEKYHDKWNYAIAVTNKENKWGPTELNCLESIFIDELQDSGYYYVNGRRQNSGGANKELYKEKVKQIKSLMVAIGYDFFEKDIKDETISVESRSHDRVEDLQKGLSTIPEIVTPSDIVKRMLDMLPSDIWNERTVFFDPACKGGEYLSEIKKRLTNCDYMIKKFPNETERYNHIMKNQIFGIALSQVSFDRTMKKFDDRGIRIIPNYIDIVKRGNVEELRNILNKEFNRDMKFNIVISNPPYQEIVGGGSNDSGAKPLFDKFILDGLELSTRFVCMITPTKWISGNKSNFIKLRERIAQNNHIVAMVDYMNASGCFYGVSIAGGVSYFLYDKEYTGKVKFTTVLGNSRTDERLFPVTGIIPRHYIGETVINKIKAHNELTLDKVIVKDRWNLPTDYRGEYTSKVNSTDIKVITPNSNYYIPREYYNDPLIDLYKVKFTRVVTEHAVEPSRENTYTLLSSIDILYPGEIVNASYMVVCGIKTEALARSIEAYLKTKFVRFLILQTLFGIGLTSDRFQFVPIQDFTTTWTDSMLYEKYNLNPDEISYIESTIKRID